MSSSSAGLPTPEGPGSVSGAPNLPAGFTDTFTSRYIDTGELRLHAVIGGDGPPLLLVHGWPETWYAWRLVMPALARDFEVVAVDQRGIGLSDKPEDGYDTGTLAGDLVALMDALGHQRFAVVGTTPACRSATRWPRITRTGSSAWPSPRSPASRGVSLAAAVPPRAAQRPALAHRRSTSSTKVNEQLVTGTGGHLLRRRVRRLGRDEQAARRRGRRTTSTPRLQPRRPARQLRVLPRVRRHHRAERAAQDPAADDARPGDRRRGELR